MKIKKKKTKNLLQLERLLDCLASVYKPFENSLMKVRSNLLKLHLDKEDLINKISTRCLILFLLLKKKPLIKEKILYMLEFPLKNNMKILLDNLNSLNQEILNTLHIQLFRILLLDLISKEKDWKPYWTDAHKVLSEKLSLPIGIDYQDLDLNLLNSLSQNQEEQSPLSMKKNSIKAQNKNLQKISSLLYTSTVVDKWVKEDINVNQKKKKLEQEQQEHPEQQNDFIYKSFNITLKLSKKQKEKIDEWFNTSNYVYNKALYLTKTGTKPNHQNLRDLLVTAETKKKDPEYIEISNKIKELHSSLKNLKKQENKENKENREEIEKIKEIIKTENKNLRDFAKTIKYSKNHTISEWELNTPKDIRDCAIIDLCNAYSTCYSNLKQGNISRFELDYRKKINNNKCLTISKQSIKLYNYKDNKDKNLVKIVITPNILGNESNFKIGVRTIKKLNLKNITIENDCKITKQNGIYKIHIPVKQYITKINDKNKIKEENIRFCGIDPGIRTFMTVYDPKTGYSEYNYNREKLCKYNNKIKILKNIKHVNNRRKNLLKYETKKSNLVTQLHWKTINDLLKKEDIIFYGDIKSHDIVKNGNNKNINRNMNDLKFYLFKQRLLYKSMVQRKLVIEVPENYTTKTCSRCGKQVEVGSSKTFKCTECSLEIDRDFNASKNILLKGFFRIGIEGIEVTTGI